MRFFIEKGELIIIEAVFFDLYETLITEWENGKKKADFSPATMLGIEEDVFKSEWKKRREQRMDGFFPNAKSCLVDIFHTLKRPYNIKDIETVIENRIQAKIIPFQLIDEEIIETIMQIKRMDIKVGLVSNCAPEEVVAWDDTSLAQLFDSVIFSYKVNCAKPNKEIYDIACSNLNVLPKHSIFIGDGGSNELEGARKAGLKAFHATWFQPLFISEKISGFPKLNKASDILPFIKSNT
ncbi:HAD-IA family hydrolase [Bacillus sp. FJAT-49711]|uniref:HAD family hydrolase n=1 Tax=Bacillus sp. FJAT-49711 TaxID=2833585 RepID=UPI001BC92A85|nr:HAD-IA family hydrolase [Bacillus sp. FJAT-49711]MBS4217582.1 HAD-IA family hydrolase [Bacillus sp. FJAT-49711]